MAHIWKVGDKAVCVDLSPFLPHEMPTKCVKLRAIYIVTGVGKHETGHATLELKGVVPDTRSGKLGAFRFSPIVKADDDFIAQMRALKPKVKQ